MVFNTNLKKIYNQNEFFSHHLLSILFFSIIYYLISKYENFKGKPRLENNNSDFNNYFDCLFYSFMLQYTIGFVFILPKSTITKLVSMTQVLVAHIFMSV